MTMLFRNYRDNGTLVERGIDEIMPVVHVAPDGEVGFTRRQRAAVDRDSGDIFGERTLTLRAHRLHYRCNRPKRAHAACSASASAATS